MVANLVQDEWEGNRKEVSFAWETPVDHNPVNSLVSMQANAAFMSNGNAKMLQLRGFQSSVHSGFHLLEV